MTWTLAARTLAAFLVWNLLALAGAACVVWRRRRNCRIPVERRDPPRPVPESHDVAHLGMALVPRRHGRFAGAGDADVECCPLHDGVVGRTRRIEFNPGSLGRRRRTRLSAVARGRSAAYRRESPADLDQTGQLRHLRRRRPVVSGSDVRPQPECPGVAAGDTPAAARRAVATLATRWERKHPDHLR